MSFSWFPSEAICRGGPPKRRMHSRPFRSFSGKSCAPTVRLSDSPPNPWDMWCPQQATHTKVNHQAPVVSFISFYLNWLVETKEPASHHISNTGGTEGCELQLRHSNSSTSRQSGSPERVLSGGTTEICNLQGCSWMGGPLYVCMHVCVNI